MNMKKYLMNSNKIAIYNYITSYFVDNISVVNII